MIIQCLFEENLRKDIIDPNDFIFFVWFDINVIKISISIKFEY